LVLHRGRHERLGATPAPAQRFPGGVGSGAGQPDDSSSTSSRRGRTKKKKAEAAKRSADKAEAAARKAKLEALEQAERGWMTSAQMADDVAKAVTEADLDMAGMV
jgi:hypothetical protein